MAMKIKISTRSNLEPNILHGKIGDLWIQPELEVTILALQKLDTKDLSEEQKDYHQMMLNTLECQLWNRYYRWENQE